MLSYAEATSRCWAEVDLSRLVTNYHNALHQLSAHTKLICVLKADAYGLGARAVARRLWAEGQRFFAVASFNEACELRQALPACDILILGLCGEAQLPAAIAQNMILTVFSEKYAASVIQAANIAGMKARVHLKIETGLNRIGLTPSHAAVTARRLLEAGSIQLEGMFTHLALRNAASDHQQIERLLNCAKEMRQQGIDIPMIHALDSIGMVRYPQYHMDAVRTGAWLYGVYPRGYAHPEESRLTLTVKTRIAQISHVPAGECLGYDETHPLQRDSVIATLSAGYIDGYPRQNSAGEVEIRQQRAPVVGLVCMDQMMVDITDIPDAREGDEVILLGGSIGVDEYAAWANLNRNESLARTGKRVPRVYLENGKPIEIIDGLA